jgi:catechol 2,3-dioxygenase-like lactoylglutathione lyase family enzyme
VQLALNVDNLDAAVEFYSKLFDTKPAKVREGYANFAIDDPPLKLVLVEGYGAGGSINHLGVEVPGTEDVASAVQRLDEQGMEPEEERGTVCCYAEQDKVWVRDPNGAPWEIYTVLADADVLYQRAVAKEEPVKGP